MLLLLVLTVATPEMGWTRTRSRQPRKVSEVKRQAKKLVAPKQRRVKQVKYKPKKARIRQVQMLRAKIPKGRPDFYVMKKGDTLKSMARKFYGDTRNWTLIFDENETLITDYSILDLTGQKLTLP